MTYKPISKLRLKLDYLYAQKGPDYEDIRNDPNNPCAGKVFLTSVDWERQAYSFIAEYELFHDAFVRAQFVSSNISAKDQQTLDKYTMPIFQGKTNTFILGLNFGF